MDCTAYHELITGAVDGELAAEERGTLDAHLKICADCRSAYETEASFKAFIRGRLPARPAPARLAGTIRDGIRNEAGSPSPVDRWRAFLARPLVRPAIALAVTAVLGLVFLMRDSSTEPKDVIRQSLAGYRSVLDGRFRLQFASGEPGVLHDFFAGRSPFPVIIPEMKDCTLLGGVLSENPDGAMAEVLYDHMTRKIYLFQTSWESVDKGKSLTLDPRILEEIRVTNRHTETEKGGPSVVLWRKGSTLCSAVSSLSEEDLIMCLTSGDPGVMDR